MLTIRHNQNSTYWMNFPLRDPFEMTAMSMSQDDCVPSFIPLLTISSHIFTPKLGSPCNFLWGPIEYKIRRWFIFANSVRYRWSVTVIVAKAMLGWEEKHFYFHKRPTILLLHLRLSSGYSGCASNTKKMVVGFYFISVALQAEWMERDPYGISESGGVEKERRVNWTRRSWAAYWWTISLVYSFGLYSCWTGAHNVCLWPASIDTQPYL